MMIKTTEPQTATDAALAAEPEPDSPAHDSLMPDGATLNLDIDCRHEAWHGLEAMLAAQADFVWRHLDLPPAEISLVLADGTFIATLNETYRDKKGATNVLSFPRKISPRRSTPPLSTMCLCRACLAILCWPMMCWPRKRKRKAKTNRTYVSFC